MPLESPTKDAVCGEETHPPIPSALTRGNLKRLSAAERRERAHRRGWSTPSPEPVTQAYRSERSWVTPPPIPAHERAYARLLLKTFPDWPDVEPDSESGRSRPELACDVANPVDDENIVTDHGDDGNSDDGDHHGDGYENHKGRQEKTVDGSFEPWVATSEPFLMDQHAEDSIREGDNPAVIPPPFCNNSGSSNPFSASRLGEAGPAPGREQVRPGLPHSRPTIPRQQPPTEPQNKPEPRFPPNFPAYHCTQNMNEIAAYLANASYVAALGGPPLANLKYGVIIVPVGEESLLFGEKPDFVMNQDFLDAVDDANRDYDRALRMHDPDKDSEEFVWNRFNQDFPSVSADAHRNVEVTFAGGDKGMGPAQ